MTVKNKISDSEALARFEDGLDLDKAAVRDRRDSAEIRAAMQMRDAAERMVDEAVAAARRQGLTWIEIASALGVSPQAARKKYLNRV